MLCNGGRHLSETTNQSVYEEIHAKTDKIVKLSMVLVCSKQITKFYKINDK